MTSSNPGPVPINVTFTPVLSSISWTNLFGPSGNIAKFVIPAVSGKTTSNFVIANWVALFNVIALFAKSISNGAPLRCLPVTLPNSIHPLCLASSLLISLSSGPSPTRVT